MVKIMDKMAGFEKKQVNFFQKTIPSAYLAP
jgi:hypothetical protein